MHEVVQSEVFQKSENLRLTRTGLALQTSCRKFLHAAGVSLALPWLDAFVPAMARGAAAAFAATDHLHLCPAGLLPGQFVPEETGKHYELSTFLEVLSEYRDDFTVISGLAGISGGHQAIDGFLTGVRGAGQPGIRNGISVDQFAARPMGAQTRFPAWPSPGRACLSWTRTGGRMPATTRRRGCSPRCFLKERTTKFGPSCSTSKRAAASSMTFAIRPRSFRSKLGAADRDKLDDYLTSVRELDSASSPTRNGSGRPSRR